MFAQSWRRAASAIEITRLAKIGGPLTKRISLSPDGTLISDGSACLMSRAHAQRVSPRYLEPGRRSDPKPRIRTKQSPSASIEPDLPDNVKVVTQDQLAQP